MAAKACGQQRISLGVDALRGASDIPGIEAAAILPPL
jgi:hypothetical protein